MKIPTGKVVVSDTLYAVAKVSAPIPDAFANIISKDEITAVVDQSQLPDAQASKKQTDFRLITFEMVLDFDLVGFLATIATTLAKNKISIFVVSAYSTDHILVRQHDLPKTLALLAKLGFQH